MRTEADRGGGEGKKWSFLADVLYGRPLTTAVYSATALARD